jgi:hypothetical protein
MIGWDEIFQPDLPQAFRPAWRGYKYLKIAAEQGHWHFAIVYYLDLIQSPDFII